jgi:hypothetical protein
MGRIALSGGPQMKSRATAFGKTDRALNANESSCSDKHVLLLTKSTPCCCSCKRNERAEKINVGESRASRRAIITHAVGAAQK